MGAFVVTVPPVARVALHPYPVAGLGVALVDGAAGAVSAGAGVGGPAGVGALGPGGCASASAGASADTTMTAHQTERPRTKEAMLEIEHPSV